MKKITCLVILISLNLSIFSPLVLAQEKASNDNLALVTLKSISTRTHLQRVNTGQWLLFLGGGTVGGGIGVELISEDYRKLALAGVSAGGILGGIGVLKLLIPSTIEKEYKEIKSYPANQKETAAMDSLSYLSTKSKRKRITGAVANVGLALYFLASNPTANDDDDNSVNSTNYLGLLFVGKAVYDLSSPSYTEEAYTKVQEQKKKNLNFNVSIGEFTGPVLSYNF